MLPRYLLMVVFCALLIVFATAMTINNADRNTVEDLTEPADSRSSLLRNSAKKKQEQPALDNFAAKELSLRPSDPCQCSVDDIQKILAQFNGPEPPFLPAYPDTKAQIITLPDQITDITACRRADGTSICGKPSYKFTDLELHLEITNFPHKGIIWDAQINQLTLHPLSTDPTGLHKILITAYLPSFKQLLETVEISYLVHSAPNHILQNQEQSESDLGQPRQLQTAGQGYCTNPTTMSNLFNIAALAQQVSFWSGHANNARAGCDREVMEINRATNGWDGSKLLHTQHSATSSNPQWWKVTFAQKTSIKTTLFITREGCCKLTIQQYIVTVGNNSNVLLNPICVPFGAITDGGFNMCPNSMDGVVFGVYSTTNFFHFLEAMAYSQEGIHLNIGVTVSFLGTNAAPYLASNAIQRIVVLLVTDSARQKCVLITPPAGGLATFSMKLKAQNQIKTVVLLAGYQTSASTWSTHQTNVAIYGKTVGGTQQLCGVLVDYYITYVEAQCNIQANEIIVEQQTAANSLRFCGFGALADCDCGQSSFNPAHFTTPPATPFASVTYISVSSTDSVQQIQFNLQAPDTVSSVCGNGNGISKCGTRQLSFKDKMNGLEISQWPYKGYNFDTLTSKLALDPAQAYATSVLTATISLSTYPTASMSQDITAVVQGGLLPPADPVQVVAPIVAQAPQIPQMTLNAIINQQASLQLPPLDASYVYSTAGTPKFPAQIHSTQLEVLSTNENDVGTQYLDLVATSPNNKVTFRVKVIFTSTLSSVATTTSTSATTTTGSSFTSTISTSSTTTTSSSDYPTTSSVQISDNSQTNLNYLITQLEKVECDDQGACFDPTNSRFTCYFDEEAGKFVCGVDLKKNSRKKTSNNVQRPPVMVVQEVSRKGTLKLSFNQPMNFSSLVNETYSEVKPSKKQKNQTSSIEFNKYRYLLSEKHLKIAFLPDLDQDASKLNFTWFASNITEDTIEIQFLFEHPTYISSIDGPNYLSVKLLPHFLVVRAKQSHMNIINPLRTEQRTVPSQLILGTVTDNVEAVSENLKNVSEAGIMGNFFFQAIMKATMGAMYTMINTFQMTMAFSFLIVAMPSNVNLVMTQIYTVASFDYLPAEKIMQFCFDFSKTTMPLVAFQQFGVLSLRLTLFLSTFLIALVGVGLLSIFYVINWPLTSKFKLSLRYKRMMRKIYYWRGIIRLIIQSYWDLCIGIMFSWQEPRFDNPSDIFDFILTLFFTLVVVAGPLAFYLLLRKKAQEGLDNEQFQDRYGSLTDGFKTTGVLGSASTVKMIVLFFVRRFLTAVVVVFLGKSSPIFQIGLIMDLSLYDVSMNFHLNAYESYLNDIVEKINKIIVWLLSFFPFLYAGIIQDTELIYKIGWAQCTLVGIMYVINMTVIIIETIVGSVEVIRRVRVEKFNLRMVKKYNKDFKVVVQSKWQKLARLLHIEWTLFDGVPPRINEQIAPQVRMLRFVIDWGFLNKMPQGAQIDLDFELFGIQQADILGDQIDEFEMVSAYQAEDLVDQIDEFSFYQNLAEEQKISNDNEQVFVNKKTKVVAQERIHISSERISRENQANEIVEDVAKNAQLCNKVELRRQPEETKSRPTQLANDDWETELWKGSDRPRVAKKNASSQKNNIDNKVMPTIQGAQESARLQRRRKPVVEETKEQKKSLNKVKLETFNIVVNKLKEDRDPIVSSESVNQDAREYAHLLSDDIRKISLKEQEAEVKAIISVCPEKFNNQKKLDELKQQVTHLNSKENSLKDEIKKKVDTLTTFISLLRYHEDWAKRGIQSAAKNDVEAIKAEYDQKEMEVIKDQERVRQIATDRVILQERIDRFSKF